MSEVEKLLLRRKIQKKSRKRQIVAQVGARGLKNFSSSGLWPLIEKKTRNYWIRKNILAVVSLLSTF